MNTASAFSSLVVQPCRNPRVGYRSRRRGSHQSSHRVARTGRSRRGSGSHRQHDPNALATALHGLGIQCYSPASVISYKDAVVRASAQRFDEASRRIEFATKIEALCCARDLVQNGAVVLVMLAALAALLGGLMGRVLAAGGVVIANGALWGGSFCLLVVAVGAFVAHHRYRSPASRAAWLAKLQHLADRNAKLTWAPVPMEQFDGTIPEEIQQRAASILEVAPVGTQLLVDRVVVEAVPNAQIISDAARALANDPFLVVKCGGETFVVGVWDEAGFGIP